MELAVVETFGFDEVFVLVAEVFVIFEFFLGEDFEKLTMDGVRVAEGLDGGEGGEVIEVVVGIGHESGFESSEGEGLRLFGRKFLGIFGVKRSESFQNVLVRLSVRHMLDRVSILTGLIGLTLLHLHPLLHLRSGQKLALIFLINIPLLDPSVQLLQLRSQHLKQTTSLHKSQDRLEDIVSNLIVGL